MSKRWPDTKPVYDTPHAKAAAKAGGVLMYARLGCKPPPPPDNGGCGQLTAVVGTNGGTMPCGAFLTMCGERKPYYCAECTSKGVSSGKG